MLESLPPVYQSGLCTVVCTTFRHAKYVTAGLRSLASQAYRNVEVVIIDDGSTDGTVQLIEGELRGFPFPAVLISQTNTGNVGLNCNRGIKLARGEYITMFSLDDVLLPDCLSEKIRVLQENKNLAFAASTCHVEIGENDEVINPEYRSALYGRQGITAAEAEELEFETLATFWMQGTVLRHNVLDQIGHYDSDIEGDDLIVRTKLWRYLQRCEDRTFALLDRPGFAYRKHTSNVHRNIQRQAQTVIDWKKRFFPDRPVPALVMGLLQEGGRARGVAAITHNHDNPQRRVAGRMFQPVAAIRRLTGFVLKWATWRNKRAM